MNTLPDPVSFASALAKFSDHLKDQKRSSATVIAYANDLKQLQAYLEEHRITQATTVQTPHLQEYVAYLSNHNYTAKSVSRKLNSIKSFFKFLTIQGLTSVDPAKPLGHPKYATLPPRILSTDEYKKLRDASRLDIRMSAIVELLLQTGVRISELANIHLEDASKNELTIRTAENNPARTIPLNRSAATAVQNYLTIRPQVKDLHLFVTKTGRPLLVRNIRTAIDRYFRHAGIKNVKVNDLRHTFVAHQLQAGVDPELLAKTVGHKRLSSTSKYLDFVKTTVSTLSSRLVEL
ncbi:MAG: tyrosine-type recombinase/integrase [bacterium]|nr:tyrosine-type recombinase/integrase [bacterium]